MSQRKKGETSYQDTAFGIIPRSQLILMEIEGIKRAWDFVLSQKKKGKIPITPTFLQKIHKTGFGWIFPEMGGRYRKIEVRVSGHVPPKFYRISQLMVDLCNDIKERMKYLPESVEEEYLGQLIKLLAWAHHRFLWIHPFQDYNGRIGRLLMNVILLNLDLPPIELKAELKEGRKRYIKALQKADEGDYMDLEKLIDSAIREAAKELV